MMREFAGISMNVEEVDFEKHFEEFYNNDERVVYFSKKTFKHEEEDLIFSYRYAIVVTDVGAYTGEDDAPIVVELMLVPDFKNLTEENKESIRSYNGYDDDGENDEWFWMDVLDYSFAVEMGVESIDNPTDDIRDGWIESEPIRAILESIGAIYEVVDSTRGFNLDRAWNIFGTTGWDTLRNAVLGEELFKF